MDQHATWCKFGSIGIELHGNQKVVKTVDADYIARAVIIAGGSERYKMGVPGEEKFAGRGVSYCAICDAAFFREKTVAVVGGGDAALTEALHLTRFASKVMVIHRRNQLRATRILQEKVVSEPKIEFIMDAVVEEIAGVDLVTNIKMRKVTTALTADVAVAGDL